MKIRKVRVDKGHTINMGDFNSVKFNFGAEAELDEGDNLKQSKAKIEAIVDKWNEREFDRWTEVRDGGK